MKNSFWQGFGIDLSRCVVARVVQKSLRTQNDQIFRLFWTF